MGIMEALQTENYHISVGIMLLYSNDTSKIDCIARQGS